MDPKLISPFLMWAIVFIGCSTLLLFAPGPYLFQRSFLGAVCLHVSLFVWTYFFVSGLWANREAAKSAGEIRRIVSSGIYSKVRHPIYFGDILLAWSIFLCLPSLKVFLAAAWLTMVLLVWANLEEQALARKFGKEYEEYRKNVPMMIPRLSRKSRE
ncbi:MAG: isoprenylcysteine carboxylmethyltransferase family protein [Candidatus Micrarchaeota archaeon]